jgi:hypothetical protein
MRSKRLITRGGSKVIEKAYSLGQYQRSYVGTSIVFSKFQAMSFDSLINWYVWDCSSYLFKVFFFKKNIKIIFFNFF